MRAFDWAATPLGAAERWPQSLKTAVRHHADLAPADLDRLGRRS